MGRHQRGSGDIPDEEMEEKLRRYAHEAAVIANMRRVGNEWMVSLEQLRGAWATGRTPREALEAFEDVIVDWVRCKLSHGDSDIPPLPGVELW